MIKTIKFGSYTRGNDLSGSLEGAGGIGGLLARSSAYSGGNPAVHNYYFADGNGNITYMLDDSQSMVASYRYDPFGNTISKSGSLADDNVYRLSSKEFHVNSGLYYFGYRFYDPSLQRWINRDPAEEKGGVNLYMFVENSPVDDQDAYGLCVDLPDPGPGSLFRTGVIEHHVLNLPANALFFRGLCPGRYPYLAFFGLKTLAANSPNAPSSELFPSGWHINVRQISEGFYEFEVEIPTRTFWPTYNSGIEAQLAQVRIVGGCCCTAPAQIERRDPPAPPIK